MAFAQYAKARAKSRLTMFIAKPDSSSQGRGIFLLKNPADPKVREVVNATTNDMIVQKYLSRPLLIDGYKFDFRIYVLVSSCNPLRAFIYKEGLARFATCPYEAPTSDNTVGLSVFRFDSHVVMHPYLTGQCVYTPH